MTSSCSRFSPGPPISSTNKTDRHDITEILFKLVLNTIKQTLTVVNGTSTHLLFIHKFNKYSPYNIYHYSSNI